MHPRAERNYWIGLAIAVVCFTIGFVAGSEFQKRQHIRQFQQWGERLTEGLLR